MRVLGQGVGCKKLFAASMPANEFFPLWRISRRQTMTTSSLPDSVRMGVQPTEGLQVPDW